MLESVEYLGHIVDSTGIRATPAKVAAIGSTQECGSAQVFLGLIELLPEVLTKPCQSGTAIECVAPEGQEVAVV